MSVADWHLIALKCMMGLGFIIAPLALPVAAARAESAIAEPAERLLKDGREALADKQPDEARQFFERIIKLYPNTRASDAAGRELRHLQGMTKDVDDEAFGDEGDAPGQAPAAASARAGLQGKILRRAFVTEVGDRVFFAENSASIGGRARTVLEAEARWLKAHPDVKIKLIGRADDGGSGEDGKVLSAKRAEAVRDKLIESGVPASRLGLDARGSSEPVATCTSALCQAQNRNVETLIAPAGEDFATGGAQSGKSGRKDAAVSDPAGRRALAR